MDKKLAAEKELSNKIPLTPKEKMQFEKLKNSKTHRLALKTKGLNVTKTEWTPPPKKGLVEKVQETGLGDVMGGIGAAGAAGGKLSEHASNGLSAAMDRGVEVGKSLPIVGAIVSSVQQICECGSLAKDIVKYIRKPRKDKMEGFELISGLAQKMLNITGSLSAIFGSFGKAAEAMPIVGAIVGAVSSAISFATHVGRLVQDSIRLHRMKKQKENAKQAIMSKQEKGNEFVERRTKKGDIAGIFGEGLHFKKGQTMVKDSRTQKMRQERLDEKTKKEGAATRGHLRRDLEDYDITSELTGANTKRVAETATNIVLDDAVGFAGALMALDPEGIGSAIGASLHGAVGAGSVGKSVIKFARQKARNHGWGGSDINKSDVNKKARRHNLAVVMYNRIQELNSYGLDGTEPLDNYSQRYAIEDYQTVDDRVSALNVTYSSLMNAPDADSMVELMRNGFYRDGND